MIRIARLELAGYRQLTGDFGFAPGLSVVSGPNESGKSTLHEALSRALFGFSSADRRVRGGMSPRDLRRPWSGAPFRAVLTLVDHDGRSLRAEWDFAADRVRVMDAATGDVLLHEQPTQRQDFTTGMLLLGLDRDDHEQLSCLLQEGLAPIRPTESLRQALQRAVEATALDERGTEGADDRLRTALGEIGIHSYHYGALPNGRLRTLESRVRELDDGLARAQDGRRALDALAADEAERVTALAHLADKELALHQEDLRAAATTLHELCGEATRLTGLATSENGARTLLPGDLTGRVASARDALAAAEAERDAADAERTKVRENVEALLGRRRAAETELERLAAYANVSTEVEAEVRTAVAALEGTAAATPPPKAPAPRERTPRPDAEPRASPPRRSAAPVLWCAIMAVAGVVAGVALHPAAFALVAIAAVAFVAVRRGMATHRPAADEDREWIAYEAARAEHERLADAALQRRQATEARLDRVLAGANGPGSARERGQVYLRSCDLHRDWLAARAEFDRIASEQRQAAEPERRHRTAVEAVERDESELRRLLAQAAVRDEDLETALTAFAALVRAQADEQEQAEDRAAAAGQLEQLLDGRTPKHLESEATRAAGELRDHETAYGRRHVDGSNLTLHDVADERTRLASETADLAARREEREAALGDPADLELLLDAARTELDRLELRRDALRIAREELAAAASDAHRRVAPALNEALARELPRVTRGRYREAMVADDLSISLVAPETRSVVDVEQLSRGTRDQIALVERIELARILDPTGGGAPLLLDDCFAHTDRHRLPLAIELLAEVAESRQVVLFSDDDDVVTAVRRTDPAAVVIELPDPCT